MKVAALQMVSTPRVDDNLATARRLIREAAAGGAELVALPEYFCFMGHADRDKLGIAEAPGAGPIQSALADAAREHAVWVIGGTIPLRSAGARDGGSPAAEPATRAGATAAEADGADAAAERVANACCVYAPDGSLAARYDKIHLFRYDNGREAYDEGRVLRAGDRPVAFEVPPNGTLGVPAGGWRVGLSVCYDLRFPELYRSLMAPPCDLIAVPSAFTHTTGSAHWQLLLRARAVENQCWVIAPAQGGEHENGRRTWGHSMIVDPWGDVVAVQPEGEGIAMADISAARLAAVRTQLPALAHRQAFLAG